MPLATLGMTAKRSAKPAPTLVGSTQTNAQAGAINKPAGAASGDLALWHISTWFSNYQIATPSGWTHLRESIQSSPNARLQTYYKILGGSEPSTYTPSDGTERAQVMSVWRNASASAPTHNGATGTNASIVSPSLTVPGENSVVVSVHSGFRSGAFSAVAASTPSGTTLLQSCVAFNSGNFSIAQTVAYFIVPSGASGTKTSTLSGGGGDPYEWSAHQVAMAPA